MIFYFSRCNEIERFFLFGTFYRRISVEHVFDSMLHATSFFATITVGGFNPVAAAFGLIGLIQVTQFVYYGLDSNDPSKD